MLRSISRPENTPYWQNFINDRLKFNPDNPFIHKDSLILEKYPDIAKYTQYYDRAINFGLRHNKLSTTSYQILSQIYAALDESAPINQKTIFFRGVEPTANFDVNNWQIGHVFSDPGVISKTLDFFTTRAFTSPPCCILLLRYPAGTRNLSLEPITLHQGEYEFISYPGEKFQVTEILEFTDRVGTYRVLVCDLAGNIYSSPLEIMRKVDSRIDENYPSFTSCLSQYIDLKQEKDGLYFEDAKYIIIPGSPEGDPDYTIIKLTSDGMETESLEKLEEVMDRIYTFYAMGSFKNLYFIPNALNFITQNYHKGKGYNYNRLNEIFKGTIPRVKITCTEPIWQFLFHTLV